MFSFVAIAIAYVGVDVGPHKNRSAQPTALHNQFEPGTFDLLGLVTWIAMEFIAPEAALPPQFVGLIASASGMGVGSVLATTRRR